MATPPLATPSDLGVWLGQTIAADDARATALLSGASAKVRSFAGRTWLNEAGTAVESVPDVVSSVVVQVAARVWVNPQGLTSSEAGDASRRTWAATAGNGLYLTDEEKADLGPFTVSARGSLWTLRTYRDDPCANTVYVPVEGGADVFPWYSADDIPFA